MSSSSSSSVDALVEAALDWLCLNLDASSLPRRYVGALPDNAGAALQDGEGGGVGGSGSGRRTVRVLATEEEGRRRRQRREEEESEREEGGSETAARRRAEEAALRARQEVAAAAAAKAAAEAAAREREEERGASKSYILKYLEQEGSSDDDDDGSSLDDFDGGDGRKRPPSSQAAAAAAAAHADAPDSPRSTTSSVIEDWEVWGDPREIERRKAERARAARPREERVGQVVGEWAVVRAEAARAKAGGDKGRQRAAGMAMASLKREAEELGIGQDELEGGRKAGEVGEGEKKKKKKEKKKKERDGDESSDGDARSSSSSTSSSSSDDDDDDGAGMGLFDDEAGADAPQWDAPSAASRKPLNVEDILRPWGEAAAAAAAAEGAKKKGGGSGGGKQAPKAAAAAALAPKAVLQQLCSKKGIPPPRFDKLPPGGLRGEASNDAAADNAHAATAGLLRYSVAVEPFSSSSSSSSAAANKRGGGAKRRPPPPVTFTLEEADDGWSTIQEAQNAAATLALYRLNGCGGGGGSGCGSSAKSGRPGGKRAPATSVAAASREVLTAEGASALASLDAKSPYAALFLSWVARDSGLLLPAGAGQSGGGDEKNAGDAAAAATSTASAEATSDETDSASFIRSVVDARAAAIAASRMKEKGAAGENGGAADDDEEDAAAAAAGTQHRHQQQRRQPSSSSSSSSSASERESQRMLRDLETFDSSPEGQEWARKRSLLPVCEIRQPLLEALARSDVVVVGGDTGCGKTTQVPQYLLESATRGLLGGQTSIVCIQPRRLAAVSVAERVSQERGERGGPGAKGSRVGYHVRLDAAYTKETRLLFCTTGILLRKLAGSGGGGGGGGGGGEEGEETPPPPSSSSSSSSPSSLDLAGVSPVVVDEVHARSLQGDFLLAILRDVVARRRRAYKEALLLRGHKGGGGSSSSSSSSVDDEKSPPLPPPPLKVVLMSATLDSRLFASYFGAGTPCLRAGGRTFPVEHLFLEDVYSRTGYRLASDARAALRLDARAARRRQQELATRVSSSQARLAREHWGDADADALEAAGALNKWFDAGLYGDREEFVRANLARVDETAIDYDLIEELVDFIDATDDLEEGGGAEREKTGDFSQSPPDPPPSSSPNKNNSKTPVGTGGAVLIFLPGAAEIAAVCSRLSASEAARRGKRWVLPLHSSVSPADQRRAFQRPPRGVRKCVVATNIAETSITIDDVSFVIDSGKLKERRHDAARGMGLLVEDFVSRAAALQRKGRAGRTRPGVCFALYTRRRFGGDGGGGGSGDGEKNGGENGEDNHNPSSSPSSLLPATAPASSTVSGGVLRAFQAPEMVRVPLEELVLQIHLLGLGPAAPFLSRVLEPPPARAVEAALESLRSVGALEALPQTRGGDDEEDEDEDEVKRHSERLTPLGRHLAQLPVDARVGKLLLMGALLGALSPALTIAACLSHKPPFLAQGPLGGGGGGGGGARDQQQSGSAADATVSAVKAALGAAPGSSSAAAALLLSAPAGKGGQQKAVLLSPASVPSIAAGQQSDHLVWVAAYEAWSSAIAAARAGASAAEGNKSGGGGGGRGRASSSADASRAARAAGAAVASRLALSQQCLDTLRDMRGQFATMLADAGFVDPRSLATTSGRGAGGGGGGGFAAAASVWADDHAAPWNRHAREACVVKAALTAALYPNVAVLDEAGATATTTTATTSLSSSSSSSSRPLFHDGSGPVSVHPSSTLASIPARALTSPYLVYLEKVRTTKAFLRDATAVSPMAVCLFGGNGGGGGGSGCLDVRHAERSLVVDGWLRARLPSAAAAVLVVRAREALERYLASRVSGGSRRGGGGGNGDGTSKGEKSVIDAVVWLLREHAAVATTAKD